MWRNEFHAKDYLNKTIRNIKIGQWKTGIVQWIQQQQPQYPNEETKNNQSLSTEEKCSFRCCFCPSACSTHTRTFGQIFIRLHHTVFSSEKLYNFIIEPDSKVLVSLLLPSLLPFRESAGMCLNGAKKWNTAKCKRDMLLVFAHIILTFNNYYLNKRLLQKISGMLSNCCCCCFRPGTVASCPVCVCNMLLWSHSVSM